MLLSMHSGKTAREPPRRLGRTYLESSKSSLIIMLEGSQDLNEMLEVVVRGIREEKAVKHRLIEKLEEGHIVNFEQLRRLVNSEIS